MSEVFELGVHLEQLFVALNCLREELLNLDFGHRISQWTVWAAFDTFSSGNFIGGLSPGQLDLTPNLTQPLFFLDNVV